MPRLFVAAWPSPDVAGTLGALPPDTSPGVRMVPPENWHVTLRFLGECDTAEVVERLRSTALPRVTARVGPTLEHLGPRQVVAPVAGVDALAAAVVRATADLGEPPRARFVGHLTVARLRRGASSTLVGVPVTGSFRVDEIAVVSSTLSPGGAEYATEARFPTADPV
ncbi:MAG: RNA 2',3'-cyclic phosphodiesterase [Ilumatobacter sp.]|nr:RNA 2',3'-cyclic phosphodiesterase [Ilumatobacter sp.]